ncbi:Rossmann-like and DUF2520 domain-containing protein [Porphyromonas somerae]|uniref:Rossmann-like and DUF2520 domain-containing protein n=1 Tax=Porphyromonas somerae TaxID=322095 RepID=UPI002A8159F9|nr:Rossmann-like and DUF2520 domain-containing protein [Porphyromonas somerae]MDY3884729.1 Rossmann-like and DUF2520 domain-containing protein [Porphyromonas somerae]
MRKESFNFALVGSGRVATHLAEALVKGGVTCSALYSPTKSHATALAQKIGAETVDSIDQLADLPVDFVLIAVKDDAIGEVTSHFPSGYSGVVLHTSGGTSIDALSAIRHRGVLYPMQTFSENRELVISEIPIFPEANTQKCQEVIGKITNALCSRQVHYLSSKERVKLHLASVFACNFVNHLYSISDEVLHEIGLDFQLLGPLVKETLNKALSASPKEVQTGPAIRHDYRTIDRHLALLQGQSREIYEMLTKSIMNH